MIAILYTTFLRDKLMEKTITSMLNNRIDNSIILVGDQSPTKCKLDIYKENNIHYYELPYDCGLSYSRNYLVEKAKELNCDYCFLTADSIHITDKYNLIPIIDFLEQDDKRGMVGFELIGRPSWERDMELKNNNFYLNLPKASPIKFKGRTFQKCDIIKNFFIAKTDCLLKVKWDNDLKLCEHEDYFWRFKQSPYEVWYTDSIKGKYENYKPFEYDKLRRRIYNEFLLKLREKYNITGWVKYER